MRNEARVWLSYHSEVADHTSVRSVDRSPVARDVVGSTPSRPTDFVLAAATVVSRNGVASVGRRSYTPARYPPGASRSWPAMTTPCRWRWTRPRRGWPSPPRTCGSGVEARRKGVWLAAGPTAVNSVETAASCWTIDGQRTSVLVAYVVADADLFSLVTHT